MQNPIKNREGVHKLVPISKVERSPFRYLDRYPLEEDRLNALKISMAQTDVWPRVLVRPHPTKKGAYQQAFGHHQFYVMREAKVKDVDVFITDMTDDEMIRLLQFENGDGSFSTQIHNRNAVDAAREWIEWNVFGDPKKPLDAPSGTQAKMDEARWLQCVNGNNGTIGAGRAIIYDFFNGTMTKRAIEDALRNLPQSSWAKARIDVLKPIWEAERAEAEAKRKAQQEREAKARKEREEAQRLEDEARARARRAKTEADRKKAEAEAEAQRVKREAAAKEEAIAKKKAQARAEEERKRRKAEAEAEAKRLQDENFDDGVLDLFPSAATATAFREAALGLPVTNTWTPGAIVIPRERQMSVAKELVGTLLQTAGGNQQGKVGTNLYPTSKMTAENVAARVRDFDDGKSVGDHYWLLLSRDWRLDLSRAHKDARSHGQHAKFTEEDLRDLTVRFVEERGVSFATGAPVFMPKGEEAMPLGKSAFKDYLENVYEKRVNAQVYQDKVLQSVTEQTDRVKKAAKEATKGLRYLTKLVRENDGLTFPPDGVNASVDQILSAQRSLLEALGSIEAISGEMIEDAVIIDG